MNSKITKCLSVNVVTSLIFVSSGILAENSPVYSVSLVELLLRPDSYIGKQVTVKGYIYTSGNIHLFLSEDNAKIRDYASSIIVSDNDELEIGRSDCDGNYVEVIGTLTKLDAANIAIAKVSTIRDAMRNEVCWEQSGPN